MSTDEKHGAVTTTAATNATDTVARATEANRAPGSNGAAPAAPHQRHERDTVVVVALPPRGAAPEPSTQRSAGAAQRDLHIAANLHQLVAATPLAVPEQDALSKEQRDLNQVVHGVLIVGLVASTILMLAGVGLALVDQRDLPAAVPDAGEVIGRVLALRPSGFVALGLLVLIATPILRVVGSIGAFIYERDWRFAAITSLVLGVLVVSLVLGRG